MKHYEKDVYSALDEGGHCAFVYCKGHIEADEFCCRCLDQLEWEINPLDVRQTHARCRPGTGGETLMDRCKPGRGAFPITYTTQIG